MFEKTNPINDNNICMRLRLTRLNRSVVILSNILYDVCDIISRRFRVFLPSYQMCSTARGLLVQNNCFERDDSSGL